MSLTIRELVPVVKCKNAGPFRITIDLVFEEEKEYENVKEMNIITKDFVAEAYDISEKEIVAINEFDPAFAIKITLKRPIPSGDPDDPDVMGCQQRSPLLNAEVEDPR